jgi:hypothetical protein
VEVAAIKPQLCKVIVDFRCSLALRYELLPCRWREAVFDVIDRGEIVVEYHVVLRGCAPSVRVQDESYVSSMLRAVSDVYANAHAAVETRDRANYQIVAVQLGRMLDIRMCEGSSFRWETGSCRTLWSSIVRPCQVSGCSGS